MPYSTSSSSLSDSYSAPRHEAHSDGWRDWHDEPDAVARRIMNMGDTSLELGYPQYVQAWPAEVPSSRHGLPLRHNIVPSAPARPLQVPLQIQHYVNFVPTQLPVYIVQVPAAPVDSTGSSAAATACTVGVIVASAFCPVVTLIAASIYYMHR